MEDALQHHQTTQRIGLPPSGSRIYHPDRSKADHALTFKPDPLTGAGQVPLVGNVIYLFPSRHFTRLRRLPCTFLGGYDARTDFRVVHHA